MSGKKRDKCSYSELPQEEKDRINARRRALRLQKKAKQDDVINISLQEETSTDYETSVVPKLLQRSITVSHTSENQFCQDTTARRNETGTSKMHILFLIMN